MSLATATTARTLSPFTFSRSPACSLSLLTASLYLCVPGGGNTYRRGNSTQYGQSLKSGDSIGVYLDMDNRTLSYSRNGQDLGIGIDTLSSAFVVACYQERR